MHTKTGIVVPTKQDKTLILEVTGYKSHPKYKKRFKVSKKFYAHNPENKKYEQGETVTIYETKPLSKLKRWTVVQPNNKQQ